MDIISIGIIKREEASQGNGISRSMKLIKK
jgi:hypothetical protein